MNNVMVIEGIDGAGKTTLIKELLKVVPGSTTFRQPGGTLVGEDIRLILDRRDVHPRTAHLLLAAGRIDILLEIKRMRDAGDRSWVFLDRHSDSSWVYQAEEGVPSRQLLWIHDAYVDLNCVDFTFVLDLPAQMALGRINSRSATEGTVLSTYDKQTVDAMERRREKYTGLAVDDEGSLLSNYAVLDATLPIRELVNQVLEIVGTMILEDANTHK